MPTMKAVRIMMVVATLFLLVGTLSTTALAQTYPPTTPPTTPAVEETTEAPKVEGAVVEQGDSQGGAVLGESEGASGTPLAFTGAELTLLVGGLGILLAGGAVALIAGRRRASRAR